MMADTTHRQKYLLKKIARLYGEYEMLVKAERIDSKINALSAELKSIQDDSQRLEALINGMKDG